jgi:5-methylcytosine-specific restriction endonuclease McrA
MQLWRHPDIQGKEYQQGTLAGYETREILLENWNRQCAYCGIKRCSTSDRTYHPRAKGGSNSITNLTLSCEKCNAKKGTKDIKRVSQKKTHYGLEKNLETSKKTVGGCGNSQYN